MKTALLSVGKFLLFLIVFLVGSFMNPFGWHWFVSHPATGGIRYFVPTGLLALLLLYLLIVLAEVAMRRARLVPWTTFSAAVALVLGMLAKFGFVTQ